MADWAMVGITFVYVIATIFICIFNYHSANAASKQIDLTKMQYVEDTRLKLLPYLHVQKINFSERVNGTIEHSFSKDCHKCPPTSTVEGAFLFRIANVGHGPAIGVKYPSTSPESSSTRYQIISFPPTDDRIVRFIFKSANEGRQEFCLKVLFSDLLGNAYLQEFFIFLNCLKTHIEVDTYFITAPKYEGHL